MRLDESSGVECGTWWLELWFILPHRLFHDTVMLKGQCTQCGMRFPRHGKPMACPFGKGIQTEVFFICFWNVSLGETDCLTYWGHLIPSSLSCSYPPFIFCITLILFRTSVTAAAVDLASTETAMQTCPLISSCMYPCKNPTLKILDLNAVIVILCYFSQERFWGKELPSWQAPPHTTFIFPEVSPTIFWASPVVLDPKFLPWFRSLRLKLKTRSSAVYIQNQIRSHSDETRPNPDFHRVLA